MDMEEFKKAVKCCLTDGDHVSCEDCPYYRDSYAECQQKLMKGVTELLVDEIMPRCAELVRDAIAMLKKQEPKPVKIAKNAYNLEFYYCPNCKRRFIDPWELRNKYCCECGQAVKWE